MRVDERGLTPNEVGRVLRVSGDRVRAWIQSGQLGALNVAEPSSKPRFVILPSHLAAFERRRSAALPPKPPRRKKRIEIVDYFPDL
jgi:hypothetical protein